MENSTTASHHTTEMPPSHLSTTLTMNTMNEMASHHTTVMPPSHLITTLTMNTMNEMVHTHVNDASLQVIMWGACASLITILFILAAVLLRYVCHHKGSYKTHEPKDEENPKTDVQDSSDEEEAEPRKQEECISSSGSAFQDDTPEDI